MAISQSLTYGFMVLAKAKARHISQVYLNI